MYYICSAKRCDWICVRFYSSNWRTSEFTYVIIDVHPTYILHTYVIIDVHPIYTRDYWRTPDIHTWLLTYIRLFSYITSCQLFIVSTSQQIWLGIKLFTYNMRLKWEISFKISNFEAFIWDNMFCSFNNNPQRFKWCSRQYKNVCVRMYFYGILHVITLVFVFV